MWFEFWIWSDFCLIHLFDEKMRFFEPKLSVFSDFEVKSSDLPLELDVLKLTSMTDYVSYLFMRKVGEFVCKTEGFADFFFDWLMLMSVFQLTEFWNIARMIVWITDRRRGVRGNVRARFLMLNSISSTFQA